MAADALRLLIVEDDPGLQSQLRWAMSDHTVMVADSREKALAIAEEKAPQVAVLDLGLPPDPDGASEGLATLQGLLRLDPAIKVIVASGNEERANAVRAISLGAYDFCAKPVDIELLRLIVERVYNVYRLETEHQALLRKANASMLGGIITSDPATQRVCQTIEKIARTDVTLLITGESGTGKELLAHALHDQSPRAKGAFVAINCAAIPENLLESELFGYEKGAFTGAAKTTPGKIETADGGTLFLDEIGDLPASLQAKLLRFLQDRLIERGSFREDLYYRLNELRVEVPPLRERHGDAVMLAKFFLGRFNKQYNKSLRGFAPDALAAIGAYNWPGNVRQLENNVRKAVVMADGRTITAADLGLSDVAERQTPTPTLQEVRKEAERKLVNDVLATTQGNISKTAKILGVSRPTLYMMMRNLGLRAEE